MTVRIIVQYTLLYVPYGSNYLRSATQSTTLSKKERDMTGITHVDMTVTRAEVGVWPNMQIDSKRWGILLL